MEIGDALGWVTVLLDGLGLMPFIQAAVILRLAMFVLHYIFSR